MPGIEFVGTDAEDDFDDDVLDTGPRRPWPRWVWLVAALLVAGAVVGVLVARHPGSTPDAAPSDTPSSTPSPAVSGSGGSAPAPQISALTSDGTSLYWLAGARLYRAGPVGRASASAAVGATADEFVETQVVADPDERTVWLVSDGSSDRVDSPGHVEGFNTDGLTRVTSAAAPSLISGAAVFNGALYVLSDGQLLRTTAREKDFVLIATVDPRARGLVAAAGALYFVEGADAGAIGRWSPGSGVSRPLALDLTDSSVAIAGSTVFVAGTRAGRDVLETLNPAGGHVDQRAVPTGLTGDLQLVAAGEQSVVVLGEGARGLQLSCVGADRSDASSTGVQAVAAAVSANVAVLRHEVFQAVGSSVRPVTFDADGCLV